MQRKFIPALVLLILAPITAELLTSSLPPVEFLNPFTLLFQIALYGSGALLARELLLRWHKGWPSLLALGAAFAVLNEGLMVKSFFDRRLPEVGILGSYGRWMWVNWVWSLEMIVFHAVFSIAIPILLVTLLFPIKSRRPWVGDQVLILLGLILAAVVTSGYFFTSSYRPLLIPYLGAALLAAGLVWLARRLPTPEALPADKSARGAWLWFLLGLAATAVFFILCWGLPQTQLPAWITFLLMLADAGLAGWLVWHIARRGAAWSKLRQLALVGGALSFFILITPAEELSRTRTDNPHGMILVGLAYTIFLVGLTWLTYLRQQEEKTP